MGYSLSKDIREIQDSEALAEKRKYIATELSETERNYVKGIEAVVILFKNPLERLTEGKKPVLNASQVNEIFSNIQVILKIHLTILYELDTILMTWTSQSCISTVFLKNSESLKIYTEYVNNYNNALLKIKKYSEKYPKFREIFKGSRNKNVSDDCYIYNLLILPIQRIPRYALLLGQMIGATPESHKDYMNLKEAFLQVKEVVEYINKERCIFESKTKLKQLNKALDGKLLIKTKISRTHITHLLLYQYNLRIRGSGNGIICVLFNDSLLVLRKRQWIVGNKKILAWCPLKTIRMDQMDDRTIKVYFLKKIVDGIENPKYIDIAFSNSLDQEKWLIQFNEILNDYKLTNTLNQRASLIYYFGQFLNI